MKTIKIGNVKIEQTAALAPMASVADRAYRQMAKKYGAAYVVGEMASAKGLCYSDRKTAELLECTPEERPMAVQLFGDDPAYMAQAVEKVRAYQPDIIDINMGCPVPKVVNGGAGSALMKDPIRAAEIVRAVVSASEVPVTVKIRKGWDDHSINAVEFAKRMEDAGAAAIAVHGRTRQEYYGPPADWEVIAQVKQAVSVPVIGNGDVTDGKTAAEMYRQTGCDLVMVGRGSYGRPWVFREIRAYLESGEELPPVSLEERLAVMREHVELICRYNGEYGGMRIARKHAAWYLKGLRGAAAFRKDSSSLETLEDFYRLQEKIRQAQQEV
ncbi:MAG: tRNA dihydrouridine synthase DusB [Clostridiales bacterium]|nr:tRNA dihydrouridine synthase DusB [Clostridiales bacterium]